MEDVEYSHHLWNLFLVEVWMEDVEYFHYLLSLFLEEVWMEERHQFGQNLQQEGIDSL